MKILPANQTLILAAEREPSVVPRDAAGQVLGASLVAAKPDAPVLYLRADYSPSEDAAPPQYRALPQPASAWRTRGNPAIQHREIWPAEFPSGGAVCRNPAVAPGGSADAISGCLCIVISRL